MNFDDENETKPGHQRAKRSSGSIKTADIVAVADRKAAEHANAEMLGQMMAAVMEVKANQEAAKKERERDRARLERMEQHLDPENEIGENIIAQASRKASKTTANRTTVYMSTIFTIFGVIFKFGQAMGWW